MSDGRVPEHSDRERLLAVSGLIRELEGVLEALRLYVEVLVLDPPIENLRMGPMS